MIKRPLRVLALIGSLICGSHHGLSRVRSVTNTAGGCLASIDAHNEQKSGSVTSVVARQEIGFGESGFLDIDVLASLPSGTWSPAYVDEEPSVNMAIGKGSLRYRLPVGVFGFYPVGLLGFMVEKADVPYANIPREEVTDEGPVLRRGTDQRPFIGVRIANYGANGHFISSLGFEKSFKRKAEHFGYDLALTYLTQDFYAWTFDIKQYKSSDTDDGAPGFHLQAYALSFGFFLGKPVKG